jgi:hypothetical protein
MRTMGRERGEQSKRGSLMTQRYSQRQTKYEENDPVPESAHTIVFAQPRAIVRGPDGTMTWMARCPRCSDRNDDTVVAGKEDSIRAQCQTCGAVVELRESGIFRASPTTPPPKD